MKFYTGAEQRHARAQAARKKAALKKRYPVELTDPITPCDDRMKETAAEVAEEMEAGLDQD